MNSPTKRTPASDEARKRMSDAKLARYGSEAQARIETTRAMMKTIQEEMAANGGIYPHNKGAVSAAEVARRCSYHPGTLHKERYDDLRKELQEWLDALKGVGVVGRTRVRKELAQRADEWKELYENLVEVHRVTETDLMQEQARVRELEEELGRLRLLLKQSSDLKVAPIRPKKD